jgi:hypothetical protein
MITARKLIEPLEEYRIEVRVRIGLYAPVEGEEKSKTGWKSEVEYNTSGITMDIRSPFQLYEAIEAFRNLTESYRKVEPKDAQPSTNL